jgi:hypothetical protein
MRRKESLRCKKPSWEKIRGDSDLETCSAECSRRDWHLLWLNRFITQFLLTPSFPIAPISHANF